MYARVYVYMYAYIIYVCVHIVVYGYVYIVAADCKLGELPHLLEPIYIYAYT